MTRFTLLLALVLGAYSCSQEVVRYCSDNADLCSDDFLLPQNDIKQTIYLIGDAGEPDIQPQNAVTFEAIQKMIKNEGENSSVVYLGDNIYPAGLPVEGDPTRSEAEMAINRQLDAVKDYRGKVFFIPGNHDWNRFVAGGREAVLRQEEYVESYFDKGEGPKVKWYPSSACSGPKSKKMGKDLRFVFIDTQWWLQKWSTEEDINLDCETQTRHGFIEELEQTLVKYRNDQTIVFMHHPLYSNGHHGGRFSMKDHVFPLTSLAPWLYVPLPFVGSIYPAYRMTNGHPQDIPHQRYTVLKESIESILKKHQLKDVIFAAGHEHNLQYFEVDDNHFVISGSGSKTEYVGQGNDAEFTSENPGFSKLTIYDDGAVWIEFFVLDGKMAGDYPVYRKQIVEPAPRFLYDETVLDHPNSDLPDSIETFITEEFKTNAFKRIMLGDQYREAWEQTQEVEVLDLETKYGGLRPLKKGGGFASNTMRLGSLNSDKQYALRSVNKNARGAFDEEIRRLKIANIIQDQISAIHPYSAVVVADLAEAAGIYHTNPEYVYLHHQDHLDNYNDLFEENIYLLEERPNGDWSDLESFGHSEEIVGYHDLLKAKRKSSKHQVDQEWVLKSRVFDIWIHDWDRHDDQWRWASFDQDSVIVYRPIPRDRDQAFYKFKGLIPWYAATFVVKKFTTMKDDLKNTHWQSFNARYFDRDFLNAMSRQQWLAAATELQSQMTDDAIEAAFRQNWDDNLMALDGEEIISKLKGRREKLDEIVLTLYDYLSTELSITGTDGRDRFVLSDTEDGRLQVVVYDIRKDGTIKREMYQRTFERDETRYINIYGLGGEDEFDIQASNAEGIKVRIIGGEELDRVYHSQGSKHKKFEIYDKKDGIVIESDQVKNKTSDDFLVNSYDRFGHKYDLSNPIVGVASYPDNPLFINAGFSWTKMGWRKSPYKHKQKIVVGVSPSIGDFRADYEGDFIDVFGKVDLQPEIHLAEPNVVNLFGFDGSGDLFDKEREYNQIQVSEFHTKLLFKNNWWNNRLALSIGPTFASQQAMTSDEESRSVTDVLELPDYTFERIYRLGGHGRVDLDAVSYEQKRPFSGLKFLFDAAYSDDVNRVAEETDLDMMQLESSISYYIGKKFDEDTDLVLALRSAAGRQWGEVPFYNTLSVGRENYLRGTRQHRYRGNRYVAFNGDLRMNLFYSNNTTIPFELGVLVGYDLVKVKGELSEDYSDDWISSYTTGIWISPLRFVLLHPFVSFTDDGTTFNFTVNFNY